MTASQEMSLLYLAPHDHKGGASRIAWYLHTNMQKRGINSHFIVGTKSRQDEAVIQLNHKPYRGNRLIWGPKRWLELQLGIENNYFPGTAHIPGMLPKPPSLIHAHNLQGKYFDLRSLPALSNRFPFLLTLHDQWLFTGHCAFAMECGRWKTGCGKCPDLLRTPRVKRDATAYNWRKKSAILKQSKLYIATPSQWLMDEMQYSMLMPSVVVSRVINNGVDHDAFQPKDKNAVRRELGLPEDAFVLLYVVSNRMNVNLYKDYERAARNEPIYS
jgi:glycosyltransferase involved in cell wall biosynthesis